VLANYAQIARWSAVVTAAVAVVMMAICAAIGGIHGLIGALLGVALVAIFFGIDLVVLSRALRVSPQMMMLAAVALYIFKIIVLAVAVSQLRGVSAFSPRLFGITAVVCVVAWCAAQVIASIKQKTLYVNPDGKQ
jgi:ATP synthase protein I